MLNWSAALFGRLVAKSDASNLGNSSGDNAVLCMCKLIDMMSDPLDTPVDTWGNTSPRLCGCEKEAQEAVIAALEFLSFVDCQLKMMSHTHISKILAVGLFAPGLIGLKPSDGTNQQLESDGIK